MGSTKLSLGQPWDSSKLSMDPVRTHYIIVQRSDKLCISSKIKQIQFLDVKSDEIHTDWRYFVNEHFKKQQAYRIFQKTYVL